MKVLHLIDSGGLYGAEMMLLTLAKEHLRMGVVPVIASIGEQGITEKPIEAEAVRHGIPVEKFRMAPGPNCLGAAEIIRYARRNGFALMHSHGYKGNILFGFLPTAVRGMPILTTVHGYTSTGGLSKMRLYEWLDALALRCMDTIVLVNRGMLSHARLRRLDSSHVHVIDNGVPESAEPLGNKEQLDPEIADFCRAECVLGSVGRYSTEKGYSYLIAALHILVKAQIDAKLVLIGEGYERAQLLAQAQALGVADRVLLTGYRAEAFRFIPFFTIYAISSLTEGLPITLLEAMRCKVPVVATKVGGIPEVLGDGCGLLVAPAAPEELAAAIKILLADKDQAAALATKAYDRFLANYTSRAMAEKYLSLYQQLTSTV